MIPEQRLLHLAARKTTSPEKRAMATELLAARADAESARREGQEIAAGLHEKLHELAKQRDEFAAAVIRYAQAGGFHDWACAQCKPGSDMLVAGFVCTYHKAKSAAEAVIAAEQPKPAEVCIKCKASSFADAKTLCMPCDGGSCPGDDLWHGQEQPKPAGGGA